MLLLKEAYTFDDESHKNGFDLRVLIRDVWKGPKYKMWWTAAYWCYAVHNATYTSPIFPKDKSEDLSNALMSSAVVNIKKSSGKKSSDNQDLIWYVENDHEYIQKQIEWINPEFIICCGTWSLVNKRLWPNAKEIYDKVWLADSYKLIDFGHPANQFPNDLQYYALSSLLISSGILEAQKLTPDINSRPQSTQAANSSL